MLGDKGVQPETARECEKCGKWVQLRTTAAGNEWLHVKVDGRSEQTQAECFPEDVPHPPRLGETVVVMGADEDGHKHEHAGIVAWASAERFLAWILPATKYGEPYATEVEVERFGQVPDWNVENAYGWRKV